MRSHLTFWFFKFLILIGICVGAFFIPRGAFGQGLLFFTIIFYMVSITAVVLFYLFYAKDGDCVLHKFFVSFNLILCVAVSILAVLPKIQDLNPRSGLLQSAVITLYVQYLTWSAMANNPKKNCNPSLTQIINPSLNDTTSHQSNGDFVQLWAADQFDWQSLVALLLWLFAVLYSSIRTSSNSQVGKITMSEKTILQSDSG
ncbi:hypothetical protein KUTeg_000398 [Tegillarca granosa]|uniref:NADH dehydrogenase subunit 6 n=1 Tax=Tegillarca granosa TaxID=220873 RepID=A0ABQ9G0V3_TEGGR|nr:hypothetical protein KUTeg_000398 [Tegillarca granosa]